MDDLDSLLQDLERATTNLKNNPNSLGGWKVGKDPTQTTAYSTARVAKIYSPQYYVNDEPLYQNESLRRSQSQQSNDYAAVNGRNARDHHEVNGNMNGYGDSNDGGQQRTQFARQRSDSAQVNELIKDLEYSLHTPAGTLQQQQQQRPTSPFKPQKSVTFTTNLGGLAPSSNQPTSTVTEMPGPQQARIEPVSEYNRNLVGIHSQQPRIAESGLIEVPLPHASSNATKDLDELMASLSDFKMNQMKTNPKTANLVPLGKIQVPAKVPGQLFPLRDGDKVDALDSMIGTLESDLNRQGVKVGHKGTCGECNRPIVGQVVAAMGKTFHPEHFRCVKCNCELGERTFFEREGMAYCERDYHRLYSPQCAHCHQPILDGVITALDKTWHPEHFYCAHCGKNFGDEGYHEKNGNAYCKEDYFRLYAPKCVGCQGPIVDNYVTALGGQWHQECFVCRDCNSPFHNGSYFDYEGKPYCESHYHDKRGTLCNSCRQPIEGRCITAMGQKYHPEHFICSFCLKQLNKGTFKKHNEKPYCHSCFDKLFA